MAKRSASSDRDNTESSLTRFRQRLAPTAAELKRRHEFYEAVLRYRAQKPLCPGPHQSAEEMIREDRQR